MIDKKYINDSRFVKKRVTRNMNKVKHITVHHSAIESDLSDGVGRLFSYARYHMENLGWHSVGYHFGVLPNGAAYQMLSEDRLSWHDSVNRDSIAVLVSGHYGEQKMNLEQAHTLQSVLQYLCKKHSISPASVLTHSQRGKGACPGKYVEPYIREFNKHGRFASLDELFEKSNTIDMITADEYIKKLEQYPISLDFHRKLVQEGKPLKSIDAILSALVLSREALARLEFSDKQKGYLKDLIENNKELFNNSQLHLDAIEEGITGDLVTQMYQVIIGDRTELNKSEIQYQNLLKHSEAMEEEAKDAKGEAEESKNILQIIKSLLTRK